MYAVASLSAQAVWNELLVRNPSVWLQLPCGMHTSVDVLHGVVARVATELRSPICNMSSLRPGVTLPNHKADDVSSLRLKLLLKCAKRLTDHAIKLLFADRAASGRRMSSWRTDASVKCHAPTGPLPSRLRTEPHACSRSRSWQRLSSR